jgi:aspartate/methionine/tyrosine aminotransferase
MDAPFLPLANRLACLRPTAVNEILAEVRQVQASGRRTISLMRGEPDFATPSHIKSAAMKALIDGRTHYPDNRGELALREAIAAKLITDYNLHYKPDSEVLVTTGATMGIFAALAAILNDGDEVLLPDPIYDAYRSPIAFAGGRARSVPAELRGGRFCLDMAAIESAWTPRCRCLLLNTPWNPVGTVFTRRELSEIAAFVEKRNLILISDEIYEAITYGDCKHVPPSALGEAIKDRTILINSLSKTYAMTGWRVGYCAAPAGLIQGMYLILQQCSRGPATFVQDAAVAALKGPQDCVLEMRHEFSQRRALVGAKLNGVTGARVLLPEGGFFAIVDVRELQHSSDEIRRRLLREHGVVVVQGAAYGPAAEGTLRISFASGGGMLADALDQLKNGLLAIR